MRRQRSATFASLLAIIAMIGCDDDTPLEADAGRDSGPQDSGPDAADDGGALPSAAPSTFTLVADPSDGFRSPTDAVASPDGATFYFAAFDATTQLPAIYSVPSDASASPTVRFSGAPLAYPSGLVLGCDGMTLYVADPAADDGSGELGGVFALTATGTSAPMPLGLTAIEAPSAIAISDTCDELVIAGRVADGSAAVLRAPIAGGAATVAAMGGALRAPTGLSVGADGTLWVLDHLAAQGRGALFRSDASGMLTEVAGGLPLGTPGGLSLTAGGGNVVIASRDAMDRAVLRVVDTASSAVTEVALPAAFIDPAGLRSARRAGIFALVDSEGSAIYRGE